MIEEIKILREFLCDNNAPARVHLALDEIADHLRLVPAERAAAGEAPLFQKGDLLWNRFIAMQGICESVSLDDGEVRVTTDGAVHVPWSIGSVESYEGQDGKLSYLSPELVNRFQSANPRK